VIQTLTRFASQHVLGQDRSMALQNFLGKVPSTPQNGCDG
jgi:hypothetical protein